MITLVTMHSTGDAYLTCAFAKAVEQAHGDQVQVMLPEGHVAIARMFPGVNYVTGSVSDSVERDNRIGPGRTVYVHPSYVNSGVRIDNLCVKARVTHADLWRAILHLDPHTPMQRGTVSRKMAVGAPLIIRRARSWPDYHMQFWGAVRERVQGEFADDAWPLGELFERMQAASVVIGPQCGVMSIACHAMFGCSKIICTPDVDGGKYPGLPLRNTYPYAWTETFAGETYDIDEFKVGETWDRTVDDVARAIQIPQRTAPIAVEQINVSVGEVFDRFTIAMMREMHTKQRTEYHRLAEIVDRRNNPKIHMSYLDLSDANSGAWKFNEKMVRATFAGNMDDAVANHMEAVKLNKARVEAKAAINKCFDTPSEEKTYYD